MQQIQEDDLQHLELFINYAQLAMESGTGTPFQDLLFIIRDWRFPHENEYGYSEEIIEELLAQNDNQTSEMHQPRARVRSTFLNINAFLMPYPGDAVSESPNFTGNLQQINEKFVENVSELVPSLFAPEKLVTKKIAGENVQPHDFVNYLQKYVNLFNGNELPKPKSVLTVSLDL